jgi:hypothetical protein
MNQSLKLKILICVHFCIFSEKPSALVIYPNQTLTSGGPLYMFISLSGSPPLNAEWKFGDTLLQESDALSIKVGVLFIVMCLYFLTVVISIPNC